MRNMLSIILFLCIFFTGAVYGQDHVINRSKKEFTGKLGSGYASKPEKFGLDVSFSYLYALDKFFAAGFECDFFWINWDRTLGSKEVGQTTADVKAETGAYNIPVFLDAQIRIPIRLGNALLEPAITVGLGWDFMVLRDAIPEYQTSTGETISSEDKTEFYHNFAWHTYLSVAYKPDSSTIAFSLDLGYRGLFPKKDGVEFNMSGFIAKIGVRFYLN